MKEIQKAIKHFECVRDGAVAVLDSGFGTKPNESNTLYKNRKLYAELAINALEKQMPKHYELWNNQCSCPNCNKLFGSYDQLKTLIHWEMPYCKFCGQALIWKDHPTEKGGGE